jgi:hypothetical protein
MHNYGAPSKNATLVTFSYSFAFIKSKTISHHNYLHK